MDSLTQIVLGASVGEVILGKKLGNKAILWGAIAGTIPDLDVLANPFLDTVEQLSFHRSITHSFFFAFLMSPILGWILNKIYRKGPATFKDWTLLFFFGFTTHAILDSFTTWGTQLFWPFSNYGVAFYNIFVVDPLYTIPFLILVIAAMFYNRRSSKRRWLNYSGLIISSTYLLWSLVAQAYAKDVFRENLNEQNISYNTSITKATPLNTFLWTITAKGEDGFYTGFYSLFDEDKKVKFDFENHNQQLLEPYRGNDKLERLLDITKGYFIVDQISDDSYNINDLRFGQFDGWREGGGHYVFVYEMKDTGSGIVFNEVNNRPDVTADYFSKYFDRIFGNK